ncbi:MAG: hypothetical protein ACOZAA_09150 [Pseudomonadota bacterium]
MATIAPFEWDDDVVASLADEARREGFTHIESIPFKAIRASAGCGISMSCRGGGGPTSDIVLSVSL